jgi:hypothetical protein
MWLVQLLPEDGELITFEKSAKHAEVSDLI